jgi:hypothetical protein
VCHAVCMAEGRLKNFLGFVDREKLGLWMLLVRLDGQDGRKGKLRHVRHGQTRSSVIAKVMDVTLSFLMNFLLYSMFRYGPRILMKS